MPRADLDRLRAVVLDDPDLQTRLLTSPVRSDFVTALVAIGADHGIDVEPAEVEAALVAARRSWLERWV